MNFKKIFFTSNNQIKHLIILPILIFQLWTGVTGVDFGLYDDEKFTLNSIPIVTERFMDEISKKNNTDPALRLNSTVLPHYYNYPSMLYNITILSIAPFAVNSVVNAYVSKLGEEKNLKKKIKDIGSEIYVYSQSNEFKKKVRVFLVFLCSLTTVWIYFILYNWKNSYLLAILGSLVYAGSWESKIYSRIIIPDPLLSQFILLILLLLLLSTIKRESINQIIYISLAAFFAGIATSTKYTGGIIIAPIIFVLLYNQYKFKCLSGFNIFIFLSAVILIFIISFLFTTPGAYIQPGRFLSDVVYELNHYRNGLIMSPTVPGNEYYQVGHGPNSITNQIEYLKLTLTYLSLTSMSKYLFISLIIFVFSIYGVFEVIRQKDYFGYILLFIFFFWIIYFSTQKILFVRNLQLLIPLLSIFSSLGIISLFKILKNKVNLIFIFIIAVTICINLSWIAFSSLKINERNNHVSSLKEDIFKKDFDLNWPGNYETSKKKIEEIESLNKYIQKNKEKKILVTKDVYKLIDEYKVNNNVINLSDVLENNSLIESLDSSNEFLFYSYEINNPHFQIRPYTDNHAYWIANRKDYYKTISTAYDIDINYFPSWAGDPRILSISIDQAKETYFRKLIPSN